MDSTPVHGLADVLECAFGTDDRRSRALSRRLRIHRCYRRRPPDAPRSRRVAADRHATCHEVQTRRSDHSGCCAWSDASAQSQNGAACYSAVVSGSIKQPGAAGGGYLW